MFLNGNFTNTDPIKVCNLEKLVYENISKNVFEEQKEFSCKSSSLFFASVDLLITSSFPHHHYDPVIKMSNQLLDNVINAGRCLAQKRNKNKILSSQTRSLKRVLHQFISLYHNYLTPD